VLHLTQERPHFCISHSTQREKTAIVPERQSGEDILIGEAPMQLFRFSAVLFLCLATLASPALGEEWQRFVIPSTGTSVEMPASTFREQSELPEGGVGRRFFRPDRRADLTVQSIENPSELSPSAFLAQRKPPAGIQYRRVTPSFFVVSSNRKDRIWYNRCNRSPGRMHCVLINYPAAEKRQWDSVVTRISHTLRP
jgi:hypothetical protein